MNGHEWLIDLGQHQMAQERKFDPAIAAAKLRKNPTLEILPPGSLTAHETAKPMIGLLNRSLLQTQHFQ